MNSFYFWKTWNSPYKQIYIFLLSLLGLLLLALAYSSYVGFEGVVKWEVETELEPVKVVIDQFAKNLFNFTVESDSYYALDKFVSSEVKASTFYAYLFLGLVILGVLFVVTTFSYLDLYWFMGGMLCFLLFLFSMKIEMLELFGRVDRIPMVSIFLLYGGLSYVFNTYYKSASYLFRLLSFLFLTVLVGLVIYKYSTVATPFLYLANFGSLFPVMITVVLVLLVGYDIIKGFLYVVSSRKTVGSKNAVLNFIFASLLYLVNVLLLLLKKLYILELDIIYLNPFVLLIVSSILGIWMFKKRSEMFSSVLPFVPAGAFVYLSLVIISFSGAAYAFINGNIGMIEAYERIIIYGHLFIGFVFFIYVLVNFIFLFDKNISVYEIVYQPVRMTFLAVPAIAITVSVFFFLYQKKYPYHLAMSGYYTYAGDVMVYEGQYPLAFQYYRKAVSFDYPNHRANYSIAALSAALQDKETAKGYFENALFRDPSVQSYIGLSNAYMETGELFKALFQIQEGLKKFPEDGRLYNNLAVLFHKSNLADSSIHYFLKSKQLMEDKRVASSNILYLLAKKNLFEEADSIMETENYPDHISFVNNKLAIDNQLGKKTTIPFDASIIKDSLLNANTYAYLVNSNLNALKDTNHVVCDKIDTLLNVAANDAYKDNLICQSALKKYYSGNRLGAILEMQVLNNNATSSSSFEYSTILGKWMLEEDLYTASAGFFQSASKGGNLNTQLNYTIAAALAGQNESALFVLNQLVNSPDKNISALSARLIKILSVKNGNEALLLDEPERLQYFLLFLKKMSPDLSDKIYKSFTNEQVKVYAASALSRFYLERNNVTKAGQVFASISAIQQLNVFAEGEKNYTALLLMTEKKDGRFLAENSRTLKLNSDKELLRDFFIAAGYEYQGDSSKACEYYVKTLTSAPFMEVAVSKAVNYLSAKGQQQTAYNYLVDILQSNSSVQMKKTYLALCLDMGLISYAESTLADLKGQITSLEYSNYQDRLIRIQNQ
jgi:hypothetical protein